MKTFHLKVQHKQTSQQKQTWFLPKPNKENEQSKPQKK
jgi:hypothetical protein